MAKKQEPRGRGRPPADNPFSERVLCRLTPEQRRAMVVWAARQGADGVSTAMRLIVVERLRKDGLLK